MSTKDFRGAAHAVKTFMSLAAKDIAEGGEIKPAETRYRLANPAKVLIGRFKAAMLRKAHVLQMRKRA